MHSRTKRQSKMVSNKPAKMSSDELIEMFDKGEDISSYMNEQNAVFKVNVDFPVWMVRALDFEANKLQIPRQAVIKSWINDRLKIEAEGRAKAAAAVG